MERRSLNSNYPDSVSNCVFPVCMYRIVWKDVWNLERIVYTEDHLAAKSLLEILNVADQKPILYKDC